MTFVLLALSCVVLTLEVLETKIFAYCLASNLVFVVVGIALLGFGAGGTAMSLRRSPGDPRPIVRASLLATAVLVVVAHWYFAQVSDALDFEVSWTTISALALLATPYFSAGLAIAAILGDPRANLGRLYGVNLLGSALGCATVFVLLGPLTAPQCLVLCAGAAGLLGALLCPRPRLVAGAVVLAAAGLFAAAEQVFPYRPEPARSGGQLSLLEQGLAATVEQVRRDYAEVKIERAELVERFDRWDPTARVQVHEPVIETTDPQWRAELDKLPAMWFTQDSSFGSPLIGHGPSTVAFCERTCYGAGYFRRRPHADVLVIGLGGAPDVQVALHFEPSSVTGVDINQTTVGLVRGPFAKYLGDPYGDPRVQIHIRDGRSFVRGDRSFYDHIQLSGVDTKSLLAAGTLAINESYLYTREAFGEYLRRLELDGTLAIVYAGRTKMRRLAVSAMAALADLGAERPPRHLMLLEQSEIIVVLVKRTEFTPEECRQMDAWLAASRQPDGKTGVILWVYEFLTQSLSLSPAPEAIYMPDGRPTDEPLMRAALTGTLDDYVRRHEQDIAPVVDDRPFFFHTVRPERVWSDPPEYFRRLFRLAEIMVGLAVVLIFAPLLLFKARGIGVRHNLPFGAYFAALGAGFILAEIGLIQRYVLFLGHQSYAFPVVIGGLLVAAGLGSLWSSRFAAAPAGVIATAVAAACVAIAAHHFLLDALFGATAHLPLWLRLAVATAVLFPLGVPLGMLFPTGLTLVRRASPLFVPWAFGINGVFSVLGSTVVMPGAMLWGFSTMSLVAAVAYVLAAVIAVALTRRRH